MMRRVAIVSAFAACLGMTLLSGCGVRGPLYLPRVPVDPAPPTMTDPGLADPSRPLPGAPASAPAASAPAPVSGTAMPAGNSNTNSTNSTNSPASAPSAR